MSQWTAYLARILKFCSGNPDTNIELVVILILAAVVSTAAFESFARSFKFPVRDMNRFLGILMIGVISTFVFASAAAIYIGPHITSPNVRSAAPIIAAGIAIMAVTTPFAIYLCKGSYMKTLSGIVLAILAAVAAVLLTKAAFGTIRKGRGGMEGTRARTRQINQVL